MIYVCRAAHMLHISMTKRHSYPPPMTKRHSSCVCNNRAIAAPGERSLHMLRTRYVLHLHTSHILTRLIYVRMLESVVTITNADGGRTHHRSLTYAIANTPALRGITWYDLGRDVPTTRRIHGLPNYVLTRSIR